MEGAAGQSGDPEEGQEEEGGVDEAGDEEDYGEDGVMFADVNAAVADDDAGQVKYVPLEGDGWVLCGVGDRVGVGWVADDPEVDDFKRQGQQKSETKPGMRGSHITRDGERGVEVGWERQGSGGRD